MKKLAVWMGIAALLSGCVLQNSDEKKNESTVAGSTADSGFVSLFDGKTLAGWHGYGHGDLAGRWKIADSAITLDTTVKLSGVNGNLISDSLYENFHLKLDWKIAPNGNSGIIFLIQEDTAKYHEPYLTGPEAQVLDNAGHPDAKIIKHRAGDLYDLISSSTETVKPAGEWNHAEIILNQGNLQLFLNGTNSVTTTLWNDDWNKLVAGSKFKDFPDFAKFKSGAIALQDHGNQVSYKNILIKKL
jgi:hypothetical protein